MAYVDIQTKNADYKAILTNHKVEVPASYMPSEASGLLLEVVDCELELIYSFLKESDTFSNTLRGNKRHYANLLSHCRRKKIPLVQAEPLYTETGSRYYLSVPKSDLTAVNELEIRRAYNFIDIFSNEQAELPRFNNLFADLETSVGFLSDNFSDWVELRNLLMAHRAEQFAKYQKTQGVPYPYLALACGILHAGLVRSLEMPPQQRLAEIKEHPLLTRLYNLRELPNLCFAQYSAAENKWGVSAIIDPAFKQATISGRNGNGKSEIWQKASA